ncbi:MAG: gliding motility-associated C-terminal domain-containing protein [Bacteroidota bacterium]
MEQNTIGVGVLDEFGCRASDVLNYYIDREYEMFIPNAFSPDGDGANDLFILYGGNKVKNVEALRIFDRWGRVLFEREDFIPNSPQFGWDGRFNNSPVSSGVYIYFAEVEFIDGEVKLFKGDVAVMR